MKVLENPGPWIMGSKLHEMSAGLGLVGRHKNIQKDHRQYFWEDPRPEWMF